MRELTEAEPARGGILDDEVIYGPIIVQLIRWGHKTWSLVIRTTSQKHHISSGERVKELEEIIDGFCPGFMRTRHPAGQPPPAALSGRICHTDAGRRSLRWRP